MRATRRVGAHLAVGSPQEPYVRLSTRTEYVTKTAFFSRWLTLPVVVDVGNSPQFLFRVSSLHG
jgi:hypothetical protein